MPILEEPGVFAMLVPEGWVVTEGPALQFELTRDSAGAAHVSVYDRQAAPLTEAEARDLVDRFVALVRPHETVDVVVLTESEEQHRAVARFRAVDGEQTFDWLVFLVLWRQHFLICSCNADPGSDLLGVAETMFASIHRPEPGRMRWGRKPKRR